MQQDLVFALNGGTITLIKDAFKRLVLFSLS